MITHSHSGTADMEVFQCSGPTKYVTWCFEGSAHNRPGVYFVRVARAKLGSRDTSLPYPSRDEAVAAAFTMAQALDGL